MELEPANVEVSIVVDDNNVARIVSNPVIPWVLPSIENSSIEDNLLSNSTVLHCIYHPMVTGGVPRALRTTALSSSFTSTRHHAPSPSSSSGNQESDEILSGSTLAELTQGSVHRNIPDSPSSFISMTPTKAPNPPCPYIPMAPVRRVEDAPGSRIWESRRPSSEYFTIYDDPTRREPTYSGWELPGGSLGQDENQENDYPSDDISSEEENAQQIPTLHWNEVSVGPRDVFGLPLNLSSIAPPRDDSHAEVHWPTQHGRQVLRPLWVDESEAVGDDGWMDGSLNENEIFDIEPIESPSPVGPRSRVLFTRQEGLREAGPVRPVANHRPNVRRVLDFYADSHREHTPEADEGEDTDDEEDEGL